MAVIEMSISDWIQVPDNPRQRDTEKRANIAGSKHLSRYFKTHDYVFAATRNSDIICKLDGHTRAFLWSSGELEPPPSGRVQVMLIEVSGVAEAKEIYEALDSSVAYKKPSDKIFGATRENKFRLRSPLLRRCQFYTQLKLADTGTFNGEPYGLVKKWRKELLELDSLSLKQTYSVLIAVMLISIRRDGLSAAGQFWKDLDDDKGMKDSRGSDGIDALARHMEIRKAEGRTAGYENLRDMLERAWCAYEAWKDGRRVKRLSPKEFPAPNAKQKDAVS